MITKFSPALEKLNGRIQIRISESKHPFWTTPTIWAEIMAVDRRKSANQLNQAVIWGILWKTEWLSPKLGEKMFISSYMTLLAGGKVPYQQARLINPLLKTGIVKRELGDCLGEMTYKEVVEMMTQENPLPYKSLIGGLRMSLSGFRASVADS